jgi:PAS domain S-box-containing protein
MNEFESLTDENLWRAFDDGPIGIAVVDMDHRYIKVNSRLSEMYGYPESEITQYTFPELTHPEDMERDLLCAEQVIQGERPFCEVEKRMIRKDGSAMWAKISASVLRSPEGNPLYGMSMVEDITARKRSEARYLEIIDRLQNALNSITDVDQGLPGSETRAENQKSLAAASQMLYSPVALTTAALEAIGLDEESFGFLVRYGRYAPPGSKYKINVGGMPLSEFSNRTRDWFNLVGNPEFSIQVVDEGTGEFTIYLRDLGEI